jgi:2-methylcitrate dehydratase PrpD
MSAQEGAMVKRMHSGRAAQSGVYGALLAARGFTGAPDVLEAGFGGFLSTMGDGSARPELLTAGLGEHWETRAIGFKRHASCAAAHTSLDVVSDLRDAIGSAADVVAVRIQTSRHTYLHCGWEYRPTGVTAAQMSIPYGVARMILDGRVAAEQFGEDAIADPAAVALARRVHVVPDQAIDALGPDLRHTVRVEVRLADGRTLGGEASHRRGCPADPLPEREVRAKFDELAGHVIGADGAARLAAAVDDIETAAGLGDLLAPLLTTANATETA